jgi:hypothetical protein
MKGRFTLLPGNAGFLLLITVGCFFLAQAQSPDVVLVKLLEGGGVARVTPRIDAGYVEVQLLGSDGQPTRRPVAIPLRNQIAPEISAEVKATQGGFRFHYRIRNGVSGRQRINNWDLVLPAKEAAGEAEQPPLWNSATVISEVSEVRHGLDGARTGAIFSWYRALDSAPFIGPGEALSGFVLRSAYAPGIVYSYSFGEWPDDSILSDLPPEVTRSLLPFLGGEYQSRPRITVGPFFPPGTSVAVILKSYRGRLESAREPFLGGVHDSFRSRLIELLTKAADVAPEVPRNSGLVQLCEFCKGTQRITSEEAIRQGIQAAVCASGP